MDTPIKFTAYILFFFFFIAAAYSARILDEETSPISPPEGPIPAKELVDDVAVAGPIPTAQSNADTLAAATATMPNADSHHSLSFFMHDILGGSNPSARAMTGIVTNPAFNGQLPFAKRNGAVFPVSYGNSGVMNNNNIPFLTGLGGSTSNVVQNNGNNFNNVGLGYMGHSSPQAVLQKLMFGTMTVIDDELTDGHELGSSLVGKAQGFYVASSVDGRSQTMAFTAMFESGNYFDSLSFFGVHRIAVSQSQLAIMGGTGKYVNAKGFATVKTPLNNQTTTDGFETLLEFLVYVSY